MDIDTGLKGVLKDEKNKEGLSNVIRLAKQDSPKKTQDELVEQIADTLIDKMADDSFTYIIPVTIKDQKKQFVLQRDLVSALQKILKDKESSFFTALSDAMNKKK